MGSTPNRALLRAFRDCEVCASIETLAELEEVLGRDQLDRYVNREQRQKFFANLRRNVLLFDVQVATAEAVDPPCRDPADQPFLALAMTVEAHMIVSSDKDLLVMSPWRGIPILNPAEFLARFEAEFPD